MYKSALTFGLLMSSLVMLGITPFFNNNAAIAQGYYEDSYYSTFPTDNNKYECQTGPLEGFFVSSVEFCKKVKFDKDESKRDINRTGPPGPPGPPGSGNNNSTLVNTFNCINPNVININTDTNQSSSSLLSGLQSLQGSAAQGLIGNISGLSQIDLNKTIVNLCIINDNDNIVIQGGGNGTAVDPCEECFEPLTQEQIDSLAGNMLGLAPGSPEAVEALCNFLLAAEPGIIEDSFRSFLDFAGVSTTVQNTLIACLEDAGVVFV